MITTVHFEGACVTWMGQVRFVDQPSTINIENIETRLIVSLTIIDVK